MMCLLPEVAVPRAKAKLSLGRPGFPPDSRESHNTNLSPLRGLPTIIVHRYMGIVTNTSDISATWGDNQEWKSL